MTDPTFYIGLISGSSMDAVDAALVSFDTVHAEQNPVPTLIETHSFPIPEPFKTECLALSQEGRGTIDDYGRLDALAGELFSEAALQLLKKAQVMPNKIGAIGSHGQNVRHKPSANPPFSLQIGDPNIIAERTGILTVADFRRRDLAAGGQGAPLAPGFHAVAFGKPEENRVIVNIGGISNITLLPKRAKSNTIKNVLGFDTGPGNCLMDAWMMRHWEQPFDKNGSVASEGSVHQALLQVCLADPYFQAAPPKSTGREFFNLRWLEEKIIEIKNKRTDQNNGSNKEDLSNKNIQATLLALTAESIAQMIHVHAPPDANVFICGGGAHNVVLMQSLSLKLKKDVRSTEVLGIHPDWVEAMLFAWLAKQTLEGKSGNCPSVTGAKRAIPLGGIFI